MTELLGDECSLLLVEHVDDRTLATLFDESRDPLGRLLDLDGVVRDELGRRVDRGEAAADDDRGQAHLEVRERAPFVGARELQGHEEVARLADAACEVVLQRDERRPSRAGRDRDVVEAEAPRVLEIERAAETHAAVDTEQALPRERDVRDREEVLVPPNGDAVLAHAAEPEQDALVELFVELLEIANGAGRRVFVAGELVRERFDLQPVDGGDREAFGRQVVRERVARGPEAHDEDVFAVVRARVRAIDVERVPPRHEPVDLEAEWQSEYVGEDARFHLGDVHRLLLLKDARFHAVVADAVTRAGRHGVVDGDERERREDVALLAHQVHLADFLAERAAAELDAQRVLLHGAGLCFVKALRARVFVAVVAVEAVVDLGFDIARAFSSIREGETFALAAAVIGPDEKLGELLVRSAKLDEVHRVDRVRRVERRPAPRAIVMIGPTEREPRFDRVEGERRHGRVLRVARRRSRDGERSDVVIGFYCEERRANVRDARVLRVRPRRAARLCGFARRLVDVDEHHRRAREVGFLFGRARAEERFAGVRGDERVLRHEPRERVEATRPRLVAKGREARREGLPRVGFEHAFLRELALHHPEDVALVGLGALAIGLGLDAEETRDEARDVRGFREQRFAHVLRLHAFAPARTVRLEARVGLGIGGGELALEDGRELREALRREEIGERETGHAEDELARIVGRRDPAREVALDAVRPMIRCRLGPIRCGDARGHVGLPRP